MNNSEVIFRTAMDSLDRYGSFNPELMARNMKIDVMYRPFPQLLGMYAVVLNNRYMFLKDSLSEELYRMVGFHEIGHAALHDDIARKGSFQEFQLFHIMNETEYEANAFAAHILIDNDSLIENAKNGYTIVQLAPIYNVDRNLLLIKVNEMQKMGYDLKLPMIPDARFLGKI